MKYQFILDNSTNITMTRMFKIFEIKRDSLYAWKRRGISKRELFDNEIASEIDSIWNRSRKKCYGTPRLLGELKDMGYSLGHNKVARIMKVRNMKATRRRKHKYFLPVVNDMMWQLKV